MLCYPLPANGGIVIEYFYHHCAMPVYYCSV